MQGQPKILGDGLGDPPVLYRARKRLFGTASMKNALRAEWKRAGYRQDMGSAEVVPPPPAEFIRVYHVTSAEFAISNIALGRLKVARFSDLNDPFELMALNLREKRIRKIARDFKDAYDSQTGLLCFIAHLRGDIAVEHATAFVKLTGITN